MRRERNCFMKQGHLPQQCLVKKIWDKLPIYYSKFQFSTYGEFYERVVCNIPYRELSYQRYKLVPRPSSMKDIEWNEKVTVEIAHILTIEEIEEIKPFINAKKFEPYRHKKMMPFDSEGCRYMDGIHRDFEGITDSFLPYIKIPMDYFHEPAWPTQKLYDYIMNRYFFETFK